MRNYYIYIKSPFDYPDFEDEMEAIDFNDLKKKFGNLGDYELQRSDAVCSDCMEGSKKCTH